MLTGIVIAQVGVRTIAGVTHLEISPWGIASESQTRVSCGGIGLGVSTVAFLPSGSQSLHAALNPFWPGECVLARADSDCVLLWDCASQGDIGKE